MRASGEDRLRGRIGTGYVARALRADRLNRPLTKLNAKGAERGSATRIGATDGRSSKLNLWFKPDLEFGEILDRGVRSQQALQIFQQVLLAGLTERKPVDRQAVLEPFQPTNFTAERQHWDTTLDPYRPFINPVRNEVGIGLGFGTGSIKHRSPWIVGIHGLVPDDVALSIRQV